MIRFFSACALVEDKAAEIYHTMCAAALAHGNKELGQLWGRMAVDEENHAQQVRLAARLVREKVFAELDAGQREIPFAMLEQVEELLNYVTSNSLGEEEMLRVAKNLEEKFLKIHTTYTVLFNEPSLAKMFDALARADDQHIAGLQERLKMLQAKQP